MPKKTINEIVSHPIVAASLISAGMLSAAVVFRLGVGYYLGSRNNPSPTPAYAAMATPAPTVIPETPTAVPTLEAMVAAQPVSGTAQPAELPQAGSPTPYSAPNQ